MGNLRRQLLIHLIVFVQMAHRMVNGVALPQDENYGKTWMYFPDGDGNILVANLTNEAFRIRAEPILGDISFELYTQQDFTVTGEQESRQDGAWQDFRTSFQPDLETKVLIHGWESDTQSAFVQSVKNNYLQSRECNIIAIAWPSKNLNYPLMVEETRNVGVVVAQLIDYLHEELGAPMERFHIIGHSLGAHAAGYAGSNTKYRIPRITGLDPALPGFSPLTTQPDMRLDENDAHFVDIIHTGGGIYGIFDPIGDVDFYPNKGMPTQPGCGLFDYDACSHGRAYVYFADSILSGNAFWGHACGSWLGFESGHCPTPTTPMGDSVAISARGTMYLKTGNREPYGLGHV